MKQLQQRIEEVGAMLKEHLDLTNKVRWIETENNFSKFMTDTILGTLKLSDKLINYRANNTLAIVLEQRELNLTEQPPITFVDMTQFSKHVHIIPSSPLSENVPGDQ